ncbi:MAG: CAP domain-containing protein [Pirellulales bacterium]|nr:CAP domain-containing protein [Pirellulales bacterium]
MLGTLPPLILSTLIAPPTPVAERPKQPVVEMVQAEPQLHLIQQKLIQQTNTVRAQHGIFPLAVDRHLVLTAERHTAWMTNTRSFQHSSDPVGENIALGQRSVPEVMHSWMSSPGHRANILSRRYRRIGVCAYRAPDGSVYWCQQFAP